MKRKRITWLLLLSACALSACGKDEKQADDPPEAMITEQEPTAKEDEKIVEPEPEPESEPTSTAAAGYENDTWADSDFLFFGLEGVEKFLQEKPRMYHCSKAGNYTGLTAQWPGTDDFDAVTQYTETFFELTTDAGGGISYGKVYDNDVMNYVVSQSYETFADLCSDQGWNTADGTNTVRSVYIHWFYQYEGKEIEAIVSSEHNEKNDYINFSLAQH